MIIVDDLDELDSLLQGIKTDDSILVVPILSDHQLHPSIDRKSVV